MVKDLVKLQHHSMVSKQGDHKARPPTCRVIYQAYKNEEIHHALRDKVQAVVRSAQTEGLTHLIAKPPSIALDIPNHPHLATNPAREAGGNAWQPRTISGDTRSGDTHGPLWKACTTCPRPLSCHTSTNWRRHSAICGAWRPGTLLLGDTSQECTTL